MPPSPNLPQGSAPSSSFNILPSNQSIVNNVSNSGLSSPQFPPPQPSPGFLGQSITGHDREPVQGPGPLRHPRPMTAAALHHELEKEQEAVVNRLTRELSLLRTAANASVASNASSSTDSHSMTGQASSEPHYTLIGTSGFTIPSSAGRIHHARTASNTSIRSAASQLATAGSSTPAGPRPTNPIAIPLSRQNSSQQSRRSHASSSSPARGGSGSDSFGAGAYFPHSSRYPSYPPPPSVPNYNYPPTGGSSAPLSPGLLPPATRHFEETVYYYSELDSAKRENEALRRRVRDLERLVRNQCASDASSRPRSASVSTAASVSVVVGTGGGAGGGAGIAGPRGEAGAPASAGAAPSPAPAAAPAPAAPAAPAAAATGIITSGGRERDAEPQQIPSSSKDTLVSTTTTTTTTSTGETAAGTGTPTPLMRTGVLSLGGARDRGASSTTIVSSVAVGVPDDEVQVGESAASRRVLEGPAALGMVV